MTELNYKKCVSCFLTMPAVRFNRRKASPDGLAYLCRVCDNLRSRIWRMKHPEKMAALSRKHYEKDPETHKRKCKDWVLQNPANRKAICKTYFERNRAKVAEANRKWRESNVAKVRAIAMRRHAAKLNATPCWLTQEQWQLIEKTYDHARDCEIVSGETYQVDHVVPLQGFNVCGLHVPWNLQILPRDINASKGNAHHG